MKKNEKYYSEDQKEIMRFIKILGGLTVIIVLFYVGTRAFVTKDLFGKNYIKNVLAGSISYDEVIIGNMLNKKDSEYYVFAYSDKSAFAGYYQAITSAYLSKEEHLSIYRINIDSVLNQKFVNQENSNPNAKNIEEIKIKDIALFKIKSGKIVKYLEKNEDIKEELK